MWIKTVIMKQKAKKSEWEPAGRLHKAERVHRSLLAVIPAGENLLLVLCSVSQS